MARLIVRLRGTQVSDVTLNEVKTYVVGRKEEADIRLDAEKGISREHFKLRFADESWKVEKESRFGDVFLQGKKADQFFLQEAVVFTVPPYEFEFVPTASAEQTHQEQNSPEGNGDGNLEDKTMIGGSQGVAYIKVTDQSGDPLELIRLDAGDTFIAGRESSCAIQIRDNRASRKQFEIRKNGNTYFIVDLGSVNGTLLNGVSLQPSEPMPLKSGDAIAVLENFLYFEIHDPSFKSRLERVKQQPAVDSQAPPPTPVQSAPPPPQQTMAPQPWDPNQQNAQFQMPGPSTAPTPPPPVKKGFDYKKNRPRLILAAIAIVAVVFALSNQDSDSSGNNAAIVPTDPLAKLTPDQKKLVKDTLQLAKSYYMQGKYEFARSELAKMQEIIPVYEDSDSLAKLVTEAIAVQQLQKKQEEMEAARAEQEAKIQSKVAECRKKMNPSMTRDDVERCLSDVLAFNPTHPLFEELYAQAENYTAKREADKAKRLSYQTEVDKMKAIYAKAKKADVPGRPLEAIEAYGPVLKTTLPDPGHLRGIAAARIAELRRQVTEKTATFQAEAAKALEEGKLKEAIIALRKALTVDPQNNEISTKIDSLKAKLQEQMMPLYQEGVLEENFGNIEGDANKTGDENKAGAKQKWKQILKLDITDGEYYKKAYIKLKKYGAPE